MSAMSNTLALVCAFSFPFPLFFFLSAFFFPDDPNAFWDFCPLPFCGRFPPGQWCYDSHGLFSFFPHLLHSDSFLSCLWLIAPTLTPLWLISLMLMTHCSHTYSTLTHFSHTYDSLLPHLLHSDSFLSCLWLIAPTLTPSWLIYPYCTFTIYTARYPLVTVAWSYSNIPEF